MADMTARDSLRAAFITGSGWQDATQVAVTGDASNRRYDRLIRDTGDTAILMDAPPDRGENVEPFVAMARYLAEIGLSAPNIFAQDKTNGFLLIEDLGERRFAELMADTPTRILPLYQGAVDVLVELHRAQLPVLPPCNGEWLISMTEPFFDWYAPSMTADEQERFQTLFTPLVQEVADVPPVVILRDYHAENLLWLPDREGVAQVGLLDFQDALLGHPAYDLVSLLQDARRDVDTEVETAMVDYFLAQTSHEASDFRRAYAVLGLQRNLRILGLFVRLCQRDGKPAYLSMIPRVWRYVMRNLSHPALQDMAALLHPHLPEPTPSSLEEFKSNG